MNFQLLDSGTNRGAKNGNDWINNYIDLMKKTDYLNCHLISLNKKARRG